MSLADGGGCTGDGCTVAAGNWVLRVQEYFSNANGVGITVTAIGACTQCVCAIGDG